MTATMICHGGTKDELAVKVCDMNKELDRIFEEGGTFYVPTVISGVDPSMVDHAERNVRSGSTGSKGETIEEAIRLANDTKYGLAASLESQYIGMD